VVFVAGFLLAGVWVANGIDGQRIVSAVDTAGPANPLAKHVAVAPGAWLANFRAHAVLWLVPALAVVGAALTFVLLRAGRAGLAFLASGCALAGTVLTAGIALFPFLMPSSTRPDHGLTVWDASSSARTLAIMLVVVLVFLAVVLAYTAWVLRGHTERNHVVLQLDSRTRPGAHLRRTECNLVRSHAHPELAARAAVASRLPFLTL